jgi:hypothetical protein
VLALVLVVPTTSAHQPVHSKTDSLVAQVVWGSGDVDTGAGSWGNLVVYDQPELTGISLWQDEAEAIVCDAGTADTSDDYAGLSGTLTVGEGEAWVQEIAPSLRSARAAGSLRIETVAYDTCRAEWTLTDVRYGVPVTLDLVAVGRIETFVHRYSEAEPDVYSLKGVTQMRGYWATGTATLDGVPLPFESALISRFRGHDKMTFENGGW